MTNDDGVISPGLWALRKALSNLGEIVIVAPDGPRSATSMSLTFHKPLRINRVSIERTDAFSVSGNPADCVSLGINQILKGKRPSIVVSGMNEGDNTSAQSVFASGTVAGAIQASIMGIPAVAFSTVASEGNQPSQDEYESRLRKGFDVARRIVKWVISEGLPRRVDFLNVNFPSHVSEQTPIRVTKLARRRYDDFVVERLDPREVPYYWQTGSVLSSTDKDTDVYAVHVERAISITPMSLDISASTDPVVVKKILTRAKGRSPRER
jgi:5'-nucleotidase